MDDHETISPHDTISKVTSKVHGQRTRRRRRSPSAMSSEAPFSPPPLLELFLKLEVTLGIRESFRPLHALMLATGAYLIIRDPHANDSTDLTWTLHGFSWILPACLPRGTSDLGRHIG
ncbi:hypothetical protein Salat_2205700 [Sesamum alatum]|uniref:Uncharacterized protein n=1 Tax=Sesamum alatum TaxID=300844 RepID=A0AAE1XTR6_9LAMI|nr:hypothetical protein Salat_2205700 [Sesamum alatum]